MSIKVTGLNHSYKVGTPFEKQVLFDINLEIGTGEFVGIVGPSQAGKSTLAQHFNAIYVPLQGTVLVNGHNTADKSTDLVPFATPWATSFKTPTTSSLNRPWVKISPSGRSTRSARAMKWRRGCGKQCKR